MLSRWLITLSSFDPSRTTLPQAAAPAALVRIVLFWLGFKYAVMVGGGLCGANLSPQPASVLHHTRGRQQQPMCTNFQ